MGRKIFSEANYDVKSLILPIEEFKLFCDREKGFYLREDNKDAMIKQAEALLEKKYPVLTACDYLFASVRETERTMRVYILKAGAIC